MSISKGSIEKIKNHVLKILDGKICSELNKLFDEREYEIYRSVLEATFSKKYEEDIYNACLGTALTAFDPANNELKILEGIDKSLKKKNRPNANITKKYNEKLKKEKQPLFRFLSSTDDTPIVLKSKKMIDDFNNLKKRDLQFSQKREKRATQKNTLSLSDTGSIAYTGFKAAQSFF